MASPRPERDDDGSVDVEAAWADIVAHWDDTHEEPRAGGDEDSGAAAGVGTTDPGAGDSAQDDGDADGGDASTGEASTGEAGTGEASTGAASSERPGRGADPVSSGDAVDDEWDRPRSRVGGERAREAAERDAEVEAALDDERYHPPEPPPLPRGDLVSRLAWAGVLGAPVFFLFAALFWHGAPTLLVMAAVVAFVAGFVTLVVRLPERRDDDDDGAVV